MTDFATIITRLELCDAEIAQIKQTHEYPPTTIDGGATNLPTAFHEPMSVQSTEGDGGTASDVYRVRKLVAVTPMSNNATNSDGESEAIESVTVVADALKAYYGNHRRLHTASLDNLATLWRGIDFELSTGDIVSEGTGFWGVTMIITIYATSDITPNL